MNDNRPIGVFDSGIGGVTVLSKLVEMLPNENFIYVGDTLNCPYGVKPKEEIEDNNIKIYLDDTIDLTKTIKKVKEETNNEQEK